MVLSTENVPGSNPGGPIHFSQRKIFKITVLQTHMIKNIKLIEKNIVLTKDTLSEKAKIRLAKARATPGSDYKEM